VSNALEVAVDLDAYFARIGYPGGRRPTVETLRTVHLAHATHVPFENLDVLQGRPILLDLESLQAKLVRAKRGGYCFEQNALFAAVLEQLGFVVTRLAARVRMGATRMLPRTHMALKVDLDGVSWLADVGFGGWGLLEPIPLVADRETQQHSWKFRLHREGEPWVLRGFVPGGWQDLYAFTLEPQLPVDYEPVNHFCSTHPQSRFVQTLTAQLPTPFVRYILRNRDFTIVDGKGERTETLVRDDALLRVLAGRFGLEFPSSTVFRVANSAAES
jgi:N-hydroxyarylamine O-acetyltransferase